MLIDGDGFYQCDYPDITIRNFDPIPGLADPSFNQDLLTAPELRKPCFTSLDQSQPAFPILGRSLLLLGFLLEKIFNQDLDQIIEEQKLKETSSVPAGKLSQQ